MAVLYIIKDYKNSPDNASCTDVLTEANKWQSAQPDGWAPTINDNFIWELYIIQIYSGITHGRVLNGELLYT